MGVVTGYKMSQQAMDCLATHGICIIRIDGRASRGDGAPLVRTRILRSISNASLLFLIPPPCAMGFTSTLAIGGHVYRGQAYADVIYGAYVFADFTSRSGIDACTAVICRHISYRASHTFFLIKITVRFVISAT